MVFIHGFGSSMDTWRFLIEDLRKVFRIVLLDLKGHGYSDRPRDPRYSVQDHADIVIGLMEHLKLTNAVLVGHSLGSGVALLAALKDLNRRTGLVSGLVLIGGSAYPEKSADEIERILRGMWDNLARVFVEYGHLDQLWDFDRTGAKPGHILVEGDDRRRFLAALNEKGPALFFGAHLGNWELLPFAIGSHPGETAVVYRPSQIASIERELSKIRAASKAGLIRANLHAFFLAREMLRRDGIIGIVVDEHFPRGIDVKFFGRLCKVTPIFARLARQFDCPIYGGVVVRLADQKFRLRVAGPLAAPRDADGKIDVASTMQMITEVIEGWIKEHPEQWLWLQRRWR